VDRKTPNFICVATIQELYPDGEVLIHFDGWGETYDYRAPLDSSDLRPIGWMKRHGSQLPRQLQPPRGHAGAFDWDEYLRSLNAQAVDPNLLKHSDNSGFHTATSRPIKAQPRLNQTLDLTLSLAAEDRAVLGLFEARQPVTLYPIPQEPSAGATLAVGGLASGQRVFVVERRATWLRISSHSLDLLSVEGSQAWVNGVDASSQAPVLCPVNGAALDLDCSGVVLSHRAVPLAFVTEGWVLPPFAAPVVLESNPGDSVSSRLLWLLDVAHGTASCCS
jgi:hypothetical protein